MSRKHTRADIEDFHHQMVEGRGEKQTTINRVCYLPEINTWQVFYYCVLPGYELREQNALYVVKDRGYVPYLNSPIPVDLPFGCATVAEENAQLAQENSLEYQLAWPAQEKASKQ